MWVTLGRQLLADGVRANSISADQGVPAREAAVEKFRAGDTWVLVATGACACLQPCKAYTYPMSGLPPSARLMWLRSAITQPSHSHHTAITQPSHSWVTWGMPNFSVLPHQLL